MVAAAHDYDATLLGSGHPVDQSLRQEKVRQMIDEEVLLDAVDRAPRSASTRIVSKPMPELQPVITAVLPLRSKPAVTSSAVEVLHERAGEAFAHTGTCRYSARNSRRCTRELRDQGRVNR
jgi:hypothetical protein